MYNAQPIWLGAGSLLIDTIVTKKRDKGNVTLFGADGQPIGSVNLIFRLNGARSPDSDVSVGRLKVRESRTESVNMFDLNPVPEGQDPNRFTPRVSVVVDDEDGPTNPLLSPGRRTYNGPASQLFHPAGRHSHGRKRSLDLKTLSQGFYGEMNRLGVNPGQQGYQSHNNYGSRYSRGPQTGYNGGAGAYGGGQGVQQNSRFLSRNFEQNQQSYAEKGQRVHDYLQGEVRRDGGFRLMNRGQGQDQRRSVGRRGRGGGRKSQKKLAYAY